MHIRDLPAELTEEAVHLWHRSGLTRPWNDPRADLERATRGATSTVVAACGDDGSLIGTSDGRSRRTPGLGNAAVLAFYESLGCEEGQVVVLGRSLEREVSPVP